MKLTSALWRDRDTHIRLLPWIVVSRMVFRLTHCNSRKIKLLCKVANQFHFKLLGKALNSALMAKYGEA